MTALILALIALGTLFGLIVRAAKNAPAGIRRFDGYDRGTARTTEFGGHGMIYFTSTLLNIMVYLITFAVMWNVFRKREEDLETEYRLNYARMCSTFADAMNAISKALDTDTESEPEQTELNERQTE